jgi:hypothetical protein
MKIEAMIPTIIRSLNAKVAAKVIREVRLDITADDKCVKEYDMTDYKLK